jgi:Holliday junction DNA helicase RuvA
VYDEGMISQLEGRVVYTGERYLVVDVNGVGYRLFISSDTRTKVSGTHEPIRFWTHLVVREDALDLYGFLAKNELETFELLISVSGVGPKSALAILSLAPPEVLHKAIGAADVSYLTKVSGIGRKIAEKIVLELKDKLASIDLPGSHEEREQETDALEALKSLGYSLIEARDALRAVPATVTDTGNRIKAALRLLSK